MVRGSEFIEITTRDCSIHTCKRYDFKAVGFSLYQVASQFNMKRSSSGSLSLVTDSETFQKVKCIYSSLGNSEEEFQALNSLRFLFLPCEVKNMIKSSGYTLYESISEHL